MLVTGVICLGGNWLKVCPKPSKIRRVSISRLRSENCRLQRWNIQLWPTSQRFFMAWKPSIFAIHHGFIPSINPDAPSRRSLGLLRYQGRWLQWTHLPHCGHWNCHVPWCMGKGGVQGHQVSPFFVGDTVASDSQWSWELKACGMSEKG